MNQGPGWARLRRALLSGVAAVLLLLAPLAASAERRVVAVGDVHGNYSGFTSILQESGLIGAENRWTGGNSVLVQTGDIFDRGPDTRKVLDLLMGLEREASRAGGQVVVLLGNHEVMNIVGDLRYVSAEEFASFADERSEERREAAFRRYSRWLQQQARRLRQPAPAITDELKQVWTQQRPLGFVEMREALSPRGRYGTWLRRKSALARIEGGVYLHGGIHPHILNMSLEELNQRVERDILRFDSLSEEMAKFDIVLPFFTLQEMIDAAQAEMRAPGADRRMLQRFLGIGGWVSMHAEGPLWFRGFHEWSDEEGEPHVTAALRRYRASYFVVGHTPQWRGRVRARFDNRVFLIDTGMLATHYSGGRASALEARGGAFTAIYPDRRVVLKRALAEEQERVPASRTELERQETPGGGLALEPPTPTPTPPQERVWRGVDGQPLPLRSDEEVMEFLRTARIVSSRPVGEGVAEVERVLLEKDGMRAHAAFRHVDVTRPNFQGEMFFRDSYRFEPAAYELAKMLGMDYVPPVVSRSVRGRRGSLQIWAENTMTERRRRLQNLAAPDSEVWSQQMNTMYMFDNLVYNIDRNQGNLLIDNEWRVWFIDHTRAFRRSRDLRDVSLLQRVDERILERLRALDEGEVSKRLRPYIGVPEITGLMARRDKLVQHFEQLIAERGRDAVVFAAQAAPGVVAAPQAQEPEAAPEEKP